MKLIKYLTAPVLALMLLLASCSGQTAVTASTSTAITSASASTSAKDSTETSASASETTTSVSTETSAQTSASDEQESDASAETSETQETGSSPLEIEDNNYNDSVAADDVELMTVTITVPRVNGDGEAAKKINSELQAVYDTAVSSAEELSTGLDATMIGDGQSFYSTLMYETEINDGKYLSFKFTGSDFTGGVHPNSGTTGETFDAVTGDRLALSDVVGSDGVEKIFGEIKKELAAKQSQDPEMFGYYDNFAEIIDSIVADSSYNNMWYISGEGKSGQICIVFTPYLIGPYAAGEYEQTFELADYAK